MKLTFLGTGTSFGVPQLGCHCAVCRSPDPRDKRTRVGAVVESNRGTRVLIDTPPELRLQLIASGIDRIDAVLFTHDHADHIHGIDDLRAITIRPQPGTSKPEAVAHPVEAGKTFSVADLDITPVRVPHGKMDVFGYRIGR